MRSAFERLLRDTVIAAAVGALILRGESERQACIKVGDRFGVSPDTARLKYREASDVALPYSEHLASLL